MKYKVHIDGGSRGNPGPAASAMVIYDENGEVLYEKSKYLGITTNNVAEWEALKGAFLALTFLAQKHGKVEAEIFADSELMVKQFNGQYKVKDEKLKEIYAEVKKLAANPALKVTLSHVYRENNKAADRLVNLELDRQENANIDSEIIE
ncbi:ribonuclease HI family protein [Carboxydothermus ferrireducens]|uniref:Ribonuclease HI n=1 Tax=Carboxydothermus ferrireducens DSM 11255 TaxID=1119529 RepID=A0ABX2RAE8_9THEO|nr:ribonuclease HI family protein [Carboxydothermus ferrireducens]NYE56753.1 ribonuclease HI [Carboxydothermus ferrireducens DSM 11255]